MGAKTRNLPVKLSAPIVVISLIVLIRWAPRPVDAACSIYEPGLPTDNGVPRCPCGYAYVVVGCVGPVPSVCANCGSWTTTGCKYVGSALWNDPTTNARCQCPSGACCQSNGLFRPSNYVCSAASGPCQNAATCTGSSSTCPSQTFKSSSTVCSASSGICENEAKCTGSSATCPPKTFKPASTLCSATLGICQNDAMCSGSAAECPPKTYKASSTVCSASSGPCENSAKCTGSNPACPAKTLKTASETCYTAKGPCELSALCTGTSTTCPAAMYLPNTTYCNATSNSCFTDATCTGNSAYCDILDPKPSGTVCGNNTLCSTYSNNTCDDAGQCHLAECTSCPDGSSYGADCTCPGGPPTSNVPYSLNATCFNGTWTVNADINGSLTIEPGTEVVIEGTINIPTGEKFLIGSGASVVSAGCININGTMTIVFDQEDLDLLNSLPDKSRAATLLTAGCDIAVDNVAVDTPNLRCQQLDIQRTDGDSSSGNRQYSAIFMLKDDGCTSKQRSKTWWIVLSSVLGSLILIVVILVLLASFTPLKGIIRPFSKREEAN